MWFISLFNGCFSQDLPETKNALYFELLGSGGLYSINYERNIHRNIYGRVGFGTWQVNDSFSMNPEPGRITTIPLLITYLSGHTNHHFELGGGLLLGNKKDYMGSSSISTLNGYVGYRYQSFISKGFLFRIGIAPFISLNETNYPDSYFLSPGLSIGYNF
jgi:hypothetical protein